MSRRKERIRPGLEIDFDLLDSDLMRCYVLLNPTWTDGSPPHLLWVDYVDRDDWTEETDSNPRVMTWSMEDAQELAEARRMLRLIRYKSYACLADLATWKLEKGEYFIRTPSRGGNPKYVYHLDEARIPPGLRDPDPVEFLEEDSGFQVTLDIAEAQRFADADALRLAIRVMEALGYDIPDDHGNYYEPVRVDVAEELHARAKRRPRRAADFNALLSNLSREP